MSQFALQVEGVSKSFGGVKALKKVGLNVKKGEIHALIGENGAGKSTLMRIIAGVEHKDEGSILLDGSEVSIKTPRDAKNMGISIIYQEYVLAPDLTVAENIFIDRFYRGRSLVHWRELYRDARELLASLGFEDIRPDIKVEYLKVAHQQVVEICKALSAQSTLLILDEPTAVLTFKEKEKLFTMLRELRRKGVSIIYISHRLEELFELCDRITVFKDGENVATVDTADCTIERLTSLMVGRELNIFFPERHAAIGEPVLEVEGLCGGFVRDVSFNVRAGEIVGFSGLVGAGRTETMRMIYGADKRDSGVIKLRGRPLRISSTAQALREGIGFLPEDRKRQGVILDMPIRINATMTCMKKVETRGRLLNKKKEKEVVGRLIDDLSIRLGSMEDDVSSLSGGNQQKVSVAKWIAADCGCMILDEPTRGVDVGAKTEIYSIINTLAEQGVAVVIVSSEMLELLGFCDRIYVMHGGRIEGELQKGEFSENNLITLATGGKKDGQS